MSGLTTTWLDALHDQGDVVLLDNHRNVPGPQPDLSSCWTPRLASKDVDGLLLFFKVNHEHTGEFDTDEKSLGVPDCGEPGSW